MRHESWRAGEEVRGSERKWKWKGEWDWRRDIRATGGSRDHRNSKEEGRKRRDYCKYKSQVTGSRRRDEGFGRRLGLDQDRRSGMEGSK